MISRFFVAALALVLAGCVASDQATSTMKYQLPNGAGMTMTFPKEMDASKFRFHADGQRGTIDIQADFLKTRNASTIRAQGAREVQNLNAIGGTVGTAVGTAAKTMVTP